MDISKLKIVKQLFINGRFVNAIKGRTFDVLNPSDESVLATISRGSNEDIDLAVKTARQAFENGPWSKMEPSERARCLFRLADLIEKNTKELAALEAVNNGKPYHIAQVADLNLSHRCYRYYAGWVDKIKGSMLNVDGPFTAYTVKEPVGVVGQIIPWNFPILMQAWKLAPSLAAGCTVVMKTAEQTPLTALKVAELINEAGFPPGVVNIVSGYGDIGAYLARHEGIDKIAFTGSSEVGYDIMRNSHEKNLKRVTLELGGKSANIISQHANFENSLSQSSMSLFFNAGQCCIAGSRTFVHSSIYDQYLKKIVGCASSIKLGNPLDQTTDQGPLVSKEQQQRVMGFIQKGKEEGARLLTGGNKHKGKGYFVEPTIFADVTDEMTIAKQEIFGPVMCVLKYDHIDEVIQRANNSPYGLGAGIMSDNVDQLLYATRKLKAGTVYANCFNVFSPQTPFGGYKDSGIGRELGQEGINSYLQTKTVIIKR